MSSSTFAFQWLLYFFITISSFFYVTTATRFSIPRLSPIREKTILFQKSEFWSANNTNNSEEFQTFYYNQTLDHFNYQPESYTTFRQRYIINFNYWGGSKSKAPIFAYLGSESPLDTAPFRIGFLTDNAAQFKALLVYIEHRYYGESIPFGSRKESLKNASTLGYFNSAQALADYAEILLFIKRKYNATFSPVIVIGGSYGGMLAAWFRLKYPHVTLGALASSAPILYFDDITPQNGYFSVVTKDFRESSVTCYETIIQSWPEIEEVASQPNGLSILSNKFRTCKPLEDADELKNYLKYMYASAAQYDDPPNYPVSKICGGIDDGADASGNNNKKNDTISKIFAGVVALYTGNNVSCYVNPPPTHETETGVGFAWQRCSEMVIPIGIDNTTMFEPDPFNLTSFIDNCKSSYGVSPRPHWVTTYYGGHDIKLILQRFASNIIFSNGLRDPYSSGGVLKNISDSVVAISTVNGSHCLDILTANPKTDPYWLVMQRKSETEIIEGWISKYYDDLKNRNCTRFT